MNILGDKIIVQRPSRTALAAVAAQTGEQRSFGLIERGNQLTIR